MQQPLEAMLLLGFALHRIAQEHSRWLAIAQTAPHATSPLAIAACHRQYGIKKTAPVPIRQS
jgi:hypothetical protein